MKKVIVLIGCFIVLGFGPINVEADEMTTETESSDITYDIEEGGRKQFEVENENGEKYTITVEEEPAFFSTQSFFSTLNMINNGTYRVTKERTFQWKVSYKIDIRGNAITRAHSPSITNYLGSVTSSNLKVDSTRQATYYIKMKLLTLNSSVNVRARLENDRIIVTY